MLGPPAAGSAAAAPGAAVPDAAAPGAAVPDAAAPGAAVPDAAASRSAACDAVPEGVALPIPPSTFIGRRDELARLGQLLAGHRVVTITGPGGAGKSRLALAAAAGAGRFPAGVHFADLVPAGAELVPQAVATAVGITGRPDRTLTDAIHARLGTGRSLLILDNCEHVMDTASAFAARLVATCPGVVVLATSRERLGVAGEQVLALPPLSIVDPATGGPGGSDAVTLFLDRARAVAPELDPAELDLARVGEICARCDGLPLAIELAAARCASLGLDGLLAGLDDRLRLLVGSRVPAERHRSLRAVLDWSHDLLEADQRALFRRLGVFAGGFDLAAAAAVDGEGTSPADLIDVVGKLTDRNLLERHAGPTGSRWRMLDVVRSYARDRLAASGEAVQVGARYRRWASLIAARLEHLLDTGGAWRDEFDAVAGDLRAALASGADDATPVDQRLTLAMAMARLHARSGAFTLAQAAYEEVVAMARATGDATQLARAALGASVSGMLFGVTMDRRVTLLEEALARQGPEPTGTRARLTARLATELYWSPDRTWSLTLADEAFAMAATLGDHGARAHALYARHYITRGPGNRQERLALAEQIMDHAQRAGDTQLELAGRAARAVGLMEAGDLVAMDAAVVELGEAADRLYHPEFQWYAAMYRLVRALASGQFEEADELSAAATASAAHAPEFAVGLFFAEAVTDLRERDGAELHRHGQRLQQMAQRFPRVLVWRCLAVLHDLLVAPGPAVREEAHALAGELLKSTPPDGHWLVGCCLLAEAAATMSDAELAVPLADALRTYAGGLAVAGRVAAFRGSVWYALGVLASTLDDTDQAVGYLERAAEQDLLIGAHPYHARSLAALTRARAAHPHPG